jgi:hypothetical protein
MIEMSSPFSEMKGNLSTNEQIKFTLYLSQPEFCGIKF